MNYKRIWKMGLPRSRLLIAGLAAAVPLVPIAAGVVMASGSARSSAPKPSYAPIGAAPAASAKPIRAPWVTRGTVAFVALVEHPTTMRRAPAGRALGRVSTRTEYGSPEALWVVRYVPGWLGVVSPLAGNGRIGWIALRSASLTIVTWELKVSLSAHRLTVIHDGKVMARFAVAIGRPSAPTPTGRFAVTDRLAPADPSGPYGCCILALTARSPHAIQGWSGGDRIAVHSTPDASSVGHPVSHGCLRVTLATGRWLMNHIPLGTPTLISG